MHSKAIAVTLALLPKRLVWAQQYSNPELTVHPLFRADARFENLVIRDNGQILAGTIAPNASIYQIDPLGVLPTTLVYTIPNTSGAVGLAERSPGIFYAATTYANVKGSNETVPGFYSVEELDLRNVSVLLNGKLSQQPQTKRVASIPQASLLNGVAFARPGSEHLLVADTYRGLIYSVNVCNGTVSIAYEDATTKGSGVGQAAAGINGLKVYNDTMYWSNTGKASLFAINIDENGVPPAGATPTVLAKGVMAGVDDFVIDRDGNIFICGPLNVITKVYPNGQSEIIAGTFNSTTSALGGPTAARFGKLASDHHSLYITTNGGLLTLVPNSSGVSRIDLGNY